MTSFAAKSRGFTLLEIMAVVLIIAMIASSAVVVFASGGPQKDLDSGIEKFVGYSHQVADLSILSTKSELPLFVLYPTGEAEPFLFEVEFAHRDTSLEPQHVELDRSGKLQWREARDKQAERERRFQ